LKREEGPVERLIAFEKLNVIGDNPASKPDCDKPGVADVA